MDQRQSPKKDSFHSLFAYLASEDAFDDPNLGYGTMPESHLGNNEPAAATDPSKKNRREPDLEDRTEEEMAHEEGDMSNRTGSRNARSDLGQADPNGMTNGAPTGETTECPDSPPSTCGRCSCAAFARDFEDKVLAAVADLMDAHTRAVIPVLVEEAVGEAAQGLQPAAQAAAQEEMRRHIAEACCESAGDKVQAITRRLRELDAGALERVFMQRSTLEVLRRLVEKGEADLALLEWEKI